MLRSIPTRRIGALRDVELYRAILGLTPPWTLANGWPDGRKKTTIALRGRFGSIRALLELDRLALLQREQFDLVRACGCAAIPFPIPRLAWPGDAGRRSPSQDPGAPPASAGTPSARAVEVLVCRAGPGGPAPDQRALRPAAGRRAAGGRPAAGTGACRRARGRPDSPPRGPRGGASDRGARGWRAWSGRLGPSVGCDAPRPPGARSPGSGSRGPGGAAPAATPGESSASGRRSRRCARLRRGASPPGSRRTPGAVTSPRRRASRPPGRTARADRGRPAPQRRRAPPPGSARPARRDRGPDARRSPRAAPARPLAAEPWSESRRTRQSVRWLSPHDASAGTASRGPRRG